MSRFFVFISIIGLLLFCLSLSAQDSGFGVGVVVGEPTGISVKAWVARNSAICGAAGWSLTGEKHFNINVDYIFHNFELIKFEKGTLPFYYGFGVRVKTKEDEKTRVGIRIPVGVDYFIPNTPLDIFFELAPILDIIQETEMYLNGGLGIRFFFG